jgi:hypothetical protein
MDSSSLHPWQRPALDLLQFALKTSKSTTPIDQLVSFLLLDVCVETTLRTYLSLPDGVVDSDLKYFDRRKYANGNFHGLADGVTASAKRLINQMELQHAKYYHSVRNQLYHQRSVMTVARDDVKAYAVVAAALMSKLLNINLSSVLGEQLDTPAATIDQESFLLLKQEMPKDIARFRSLVEQIVEKIEPKLVYPSTISKLAYIATCTIATSFPQGLKELRELIQNSITDSDIRSWFLGLLSDDVEYDDKQVLENSSFIMELGQDHISLYSLIIGVFFLPLDEVGKDSLDRYEDISFVSNDDYSIMGVYNASSGLLTHWLHQEKILSSDLRLLERTLEVHKKLKLAIQGLDNLLRQSFSKHSL